MKRTTTLLLIILGSFSLLHVAAQNKLILDSSYAVNGKFESGGQEDYFTRIFVQGDGKQIVAGSNGGPSYGFNLSRINANGSVDSSFGNNGETITQIENLSLMRAAVLTPDEKIICLGLYGEQFVIIQYLNTGIIDSSFGVNGIVTGPENCGGAAIGLDKNGLIVVSGSASVNNKNAFVCRYLANGDIDKSFGRRGVCYFRWRSGVYYAFTTSQLAIQTDGKVIVTGDFESDTKSYIVLKRFTSAGVIDSSYAVNSELFVDIEPGAFGRDLKLQSDNKAILLGNYVVNRRQYTFVARFNSNGSLDRSFGDLSGHTIIKNTLNTESTRFIVQPDNKLLIPFIIMRNLVSNDRDFGLMQTSANGIPDAAFGVNGQQVILPVTDSGEYMYDAAIRFDGKIITGAEKQVINNDGFYVHRVIRCYKEAVVNKNKNIAAKTLESTIKIFPNPAKDNLHISNLPANGSHIFISDMQGKTRITATVNSSNPVVDISRLEAGVYYLKTSVNTPAIKFIKAGN